MVPPGGLAARHPDLAAVQALLDPFLLVLERRVQYGGADFIKAAGDLKKERMKKNVAIKMRRCTYWQEKNVA